MQTSIKEALVLPISLVITALTAMPSMAGVLTYATKVEFYNNKDTKMEESRKTQNNAIGAPQIVPKNTDFLSLGIGGEAIFSFGTLFSKQVTLWETTWGTYNKQSDYDEKVEVFVGNSLDGNDWLNIGTIQNIADNAYKNSLGATLNINNDNTYKYVKLVDKSQSRDGRDGFDVNAIAVMGVEVASVPEPTSASALLAVSILGASSVLKRKQQKA